MSTTATVVYSRMDDLEIRLDIDFPLKEEFTDSTIPALIFFHGGGLIAGNRQSFIPMQLKRDILAIGWAFISADYRLLIPCTGHDILADVKSLFNYLSSDQLNKDLNDVSYRIDPSRLAVAGASGGAYVAYLAAVNAIPKPKAVFSLYGLGGHLISPFYYSVKSPMTINVADYQLYLNSIDGKSDFLRPLSDVPLAWPIPEDGEKARTTGALAQVFIETGTLLDYLTGIRGLSEILRSTSASEQDARKKIPKEAQCLFPELDVAAFPPTYLVHGTADQAAPADNSTFLARQLEFSHIPHILMLAEGRSHGFNAEADAEVVYIKYIKGVIEFFLKHVCNTGSK
ncbi:unnamed protein product [Rotaria sp. Silwood1]|nr:unnamed protein product [Rotaria sp. Silwood1]CAF1469542.1 unnamed protein product [Rotaria sp. Silwood1]CAF3606561.1 unnamed protein product [Rotaria sp. Silwood1]CAF4904586.1 unnamed protein product [Rotaria sp. Silwood1]